MKSLFNERVMDSVMLSPFKELMIRMLPVRKFVWTDPDGCEVTFKEWRGVFYILDIKEKRRGR